MNNKEINVDLFVRKRRVVSLYRKFLIEIPKEFDSFVFAEQRETISLFKVILKSKISQLNPKVIPGGKIELYYKEIRMLSTNDIATSYRCTTVSFYTLISIMENTAKLLNTSAIKLYGDLYADLKIYEEKEFDILNGE